MNSPSDRDIFLEHRRKASQQADSLLVSEPPLGLTLTIAGIALLLAAGVVWAAQVRVGRVVPAQVRLSDPSSVQPGAVIEGELEVARLRRLDASFTLDLGPQCAGATSAVVDRNATAARVRINLPAKCQFSTNPAGEVSQAQLIANPESLAARLIGRAF